MKPGMRVQLPSAIAQIYEAVAELEERYPGRPFTPDGHLVGSLGEVVAQEIFKFDLYPPSNKGHDARCETRGDVEIKITAGRSVAFRGDCNHLIVLQIVSPHEAEIIYDGPGAPVLAIAGKIASNGQRRASISRIKAQARSQFGNC
ncbi:hypothetical protein QA645_22895 [Bradyrhizobium sp. CIAT3101]|uniref:DUF6998 domain-containing protein n=1 Tax=Bradyrhizobium sp. CIAT3101 TaxID=439387 RepID=UPI0024B1FE64|nr:hypothetical protein [Bradyrhizobium sp. CIAT3101]WFU77405.1 hypothetical protein QA645_22895 [Bradyrhizobium sp. CIAT3101]